jgi:hypothetical protein
MGAPCCILYFDTAQSTVTLAASAPNIRGYALYIGNAQPALPPFPDLNCVDVSSLRPHLQTRTYLNMGNVRSDTRVVFWFRANGHFARILPDLHIIFTIV